MISYFFYMSQNNVTFYLLKKILKFVSPKLTQKMVGRYNDLNKKMTHHLYHHGPDIMPPPT